MWDCLAFEINLPINHPSSSIGLATTNHQTPECIEYFLENDIPGGLVALSLPDQPVGVKGLVIKFFLSLVVFMDERFVVNTKVHKPLLRLLRSCVEPDLGSHETDLSPRATDDPQNYEEAVVELMCHLCARIKTYPELLLVFLHNRSRSSQAQLVDPPPHSSSSSSSSAAALHQTLPSTPSHPRFDSRPGATLPPAHRKSVHFSPLPRSPSPSELSGIMGDASNHTTLGPSLSSSSRHLYGESSRSSNPRLDLIGNVFKPDSDMLIFSYLLRFLHREGRTGDLARAGLLFLMELAMGRRPHQSAHGSIDPQDSTPADTISMAFGEWVLDSDFADVLGASLGAAYGLLPTKLVITPRDPSSEDSAGRMVLGGMAIHFSEGLAESPHAVQEKEREERRQRLLIGLGVSGSEEFRSQIDLFLKLIEFAQDVMRNVHQSTLDHYMSPTEILLASRSPKAAGLNTTTILPTQAHLEASSEQPAGPSAAEIVASAVSSAVLFSIRKSFLNGIIYPSLLECSEFDGSAVAVMSYLEAMLSLLETDGELSDSVLRFLMAEDDEGLELGLETLVSSHQPEIMQLRSASPTRRKSGVVSIIHADYHKAKPGRRRGDGLISDTGITYFNSLGRFTLKDLLVNNIQSTNTPTATAALKLLNVILVRHDRYALTLLDIIPDPTATAFPFPHSTEEVDGKINGPSRLDSSKSDQGEEEETEFIYPIDRNDPINSANGLQNDDDEEFQYPGESDSVKRLTDGDEEFKCPTPTKSTSALPSSFTPDNQSNTQQQSHGTDRSHTLKPSLDLVKKIHCSPCPTYRAHRDEIEYLSNLIELIAPSNAVMRADSAPGSLSTAFSHYLLDAEAQLTGTATFRRGLLFDYVSASMISIPAEPLGEKRLSSHPFTLKPSIPKNESPLDFIDHPIIRHQLTAEAPIVSSILESLAKFFVQPPALNLILTGCVATLASCPTRSLEGWMLPTTRLEEEAGDDDDSFEQSILTCFNPRNPVVDFDEGDDRSVDFALGEYFGSDRQLRSPRKTIGSSIYDRSNHARDQSADCLLEVYSRLAEQVAGYRETIKGFDKYLKERRQGLIFVENLEDAFDTLSGTMTRSEKLEEQLESTEPPKTSVKDRVGRLVEQAKPTTPIIPLVPPPTLATKAKESSFFGSLFKSRSKSPSPRSQQSVRSRNPKSSIEPILTSAALDRSIAVQPFSDHYQQTGSIQLTVVPVSTPGSMKKKRRRRRGSKGGNSSGSMDAIDLSDEEDDDLEDEGIEQGPDTPTRRRPKDVQELPEFKLGSSDLSSHRSIEDQELVLGSRSEDLSDDDQDHDPVDHSTHSQSISLSMVLDNAVILEESIKELGAILSARKSLGIDPVRIL